MATYTDSLGFDKGSASYPDKGRLDITKLAVELDFVARAYAAVVILSMPVYKPAKVGPTLLTNLVS